MSYTPWVVFLNFTILTCHSAGLPWSPFDEVVTGSAVNLMDATTIRGSVKTALEPLYETDNQNYSSHHPKRRPLAGLEQEQSCAECLRVSLEGLRAIAWSCMCVRDKQQKNTTRAQKEGSKDTSDTAGEARDWEYQDGTDVSTKRWAGTMRKVTFPEHSEIHTAEGKKNR